MRKLLPIYLVIAFVWLVYAYFLAQAFSDKKLLFRVDFKAYYVAAAIVKDGKINSLYSINVQNEYERRLTGSLDRQTTLTYRSIPVVALLFAPFAYLNYRDAVIVNIFIQTLALIFIFIYLNKLVASKTNYLLAMLISLAYLPIIGSVAYGQVSIYLCIFLIMAFVALKEKKDALAGIIASFLLIKVQYLIFVPYFFLMAKDKVKFAKNFLVCFVAWIFINSLVYGVNFVTDYPKFLMKSENMALGTSVNQNYNLFSLNQFHWPTETIYPIVIVLYLISLYFIYKSTSLDKQICCSVFLSLGLNRHTMGTDQLLLVIPLFILLKTFPFKKQKISALIFAVLFFLPLTGINNLQWFGGIVLVILGFTSITLKKRLES